MFGTLTVGSDVFNSIGNGTYAHSTVVHGGPFAGFKLNPGKKSNSNSPTQASVVRIAEFANVTTNKYDRLVINVQFSVPDAITAASVDFGVQQTSDLLTPAFLNRLLLGEN